MLTSKELVRAIKEGDEKKDNLEISRNGGVKVQSCVGSAQEKEEVSQRVNALVRPLNQARVSVKSSLSEAEWDIETSTITIVRNAGRQDQGTKLSPEEAVYLMENNSLLVTRAGGVTLSLQQAYTLLLAPESEGGLSCSEYQVYSRLTRAGYKLIRHQPSSLHQTAEVVTDNLHPDVDSTTLTPLYGCNLRVEPGQDPPVWLQEIREGVSPDFTSSREQSLYGLQSWVKDMMEDLAEDIVDSALDICIENSLKRNSSHFVDQHPNNTKTPRLEGFVGDMSPKYEADPGSDDDLYPLCERCVRNHDGGEKVCTARQKQCRLCDEEGHLSNVHQDQVREGKQGVRDRIRKVLSRGRGEELTEWDLWGRFAPEIVTIDEGSEGEEIGEAENHLMQENPSEVVEVNNEDKDSDEDEETDNIFINPFHSDVVNENYSSNLEKDDCIIDLESSKEREYPDDAEIHVIEDLSVNILDEKRKSRPPSYQNSVDTVIEREAGLRKKQRGDLVLDFSLTNLSCQLCGITCNSLASLESHKQGKQHYKNTRRFRPSQKVSYLSGNREDESLSKEELKSADKFVCSVCNIETSNRDGLQAHFLGKKHLRIVANLAERGITIAPLPSRNDIEVVTDETTLLQDISAKNRLPSPVSAFTGSSIGVSSKTRQQLLKCIPNCFDKTLLILDRPTQNLIPRNTWPMNRHSAYIELDKLKRKDQEEEQLHQLLFEEPEDQFELSNAEAFGASTFNSGQIATEDTEVEAAIFCDLCSKEFEDEREWNIHLQSEGHMNKMLGIPEIDLTEGTSVNDTEVITVDDDNSPLRNSKSPVVQPFRGFWSAKEVTVSLASVGGVFPTNHNFGYHAKPSKWRKKAMNIGQNRKITKKGLLRETVDKFKRVQQSGLTGCDVQRWVRETSGSFGDLQCRVAEYQKNNRDNDVQREELASKVAQGCATGSGKKRVEVDVVDLSSDEEKGNEGNGIFPSTALISLGSEGYNESSASSSTSISSSTSHNDVSAHSDLKYMKDGPLASLWSYEGNVGPLVCPEMGASLKELYSRLRMETRPVSYRTEGTEKQSQLVVSFDMYLAENFKKKTTPDYRIIVQDFQSPVPSNQDLACLDEQLPDRVPFLFAVVNGGTVTYTCLDNVKLPSYFNNS